MAVDTVLASLSDVMPDYRKVRDCVAGERAIKTKRVEYLARPDADDLTPAGNVRYDSYLQRATFYGVTGRTLRGLVGLVFDKDPAIAIPDVLKPVEVDASGSGMSLHQQAQKTLSDVMAVGRAGLLTDYPVTDGPTTREQQVTGNIRPTISRYEAEQIINWRTRTVGAKIMLSLVVLRETYTAEDDGFAETILVQYRVLKLTPEGVYTQELHKQDAQSAFLDAQVFVPTDGKGKALTEIPFTFVGAEDNDPEIDRPPLLDIAELNIKHYGNSADYEESVFMVGQPTPVFSGLTKKWVDDVYSVIDPETGLVTSRREVRLGSRAAILLPEGGSAELLQAAPNSMAFEAMAHKEDQMKALGAKLIESQGTQQTATEATQDHVLDNSVLATAARNVSKAYKQCLTWCMLFTTGTMVDDSEVIDYELSTDFAARMLSAQDRDQIVGMWVKKAITFEEMRWNLQRTNTAYLDDQDAKDQLAAEQETSLAFEATAAKTLADAVGTPAPGVPPKKA